MLEEFDVISPDGIPIHPTDTYPSRAAAKTAFTQWKKRYEKQGYYSSNGRQIPLDELEAYCKIIEVKQ